MPKTLKAREIFINPDLYPVRVTMEPKELLLFALKNNITVFETESEYIIPSDVCLIAKKERSDKE